MKVYDTRKATRYFFKEVPQKLEQLHHIQGESVEKNNFNYHNVPLFIFKVLNVFV